MDLQKLYEAFLEEEKIAKTEADLHYKRFVEPFIHRNDLLTKDLWLSAYLSGWMANWSKVNNVKNESKQEEYSGTPI